MSETFIDEMKRYVGFKADDEACLRDLRPLVESHFVAVANAFYARLEQHEGARRVFSGPEQVQRLKGTMVEWMRLLFTGPWDEAYYQRRARIGRVHVKIALPQRFMFGAMHLIRLHLIEVVDTALSNDADRQRAARAMHRILDIELAIMLESYREAYVDIRTQRAERLASLGTMAAGLAHELRNPLNSAHLQLSVAQRKLARGGAEGLDSAKIAIGLAESEMKRLAGLVEDFLQFARPQALRLSRVDLRNTAEVIVALMAPEATAAGVRLQLEPGPPVRLEFDDEKMKQVLVNLVLNAIEVSAPQQSVMVRVDASGGWAYLRVQDSGPGIPSDSPIFEPFFTTKEQGTGLGLAIVHRIVHDHGGQVTVDSAPGRTVFSIALPIADPDLPPIPSSVLRQV